MVVPLRRDHASGRGPSQTPGLATVPDLVVLVTPGYERLSIGARCESPDGRDGSDGDDVGRNDHCTNGVSDTNSPI